MAIDQQLLSDLAPDGRLSAAINLGNPVLAQGDPGSPRGVTVDIARAVARRLDTDVRFVCFDAARDSFAAVTSGTAAIAFLADEPARAKHVAFTAPYVLIDGVYAVPDSSPYASPAEADTDGVRIGVKQGSAYDLFLTRTLTRATIVRGTDGTAVFAEQGLDVAAGIREPVTAYVEEHPGLRVLDEPFMQIRQALATRRSAHPDTTAWLNGVLTELLTSGFVAESLRRSGRSETLAADPPPAA